MLLAGDSYGNTAWDLAARWGKLDVLQKMWDLYKFSLTTEEIRNNLLLSTDSEGNTSWHLAARCGYLDVLQKIWDLAKGSLKYKKKVC
jgi:ankyrin repeat protein